MKTLSLFTLLLVITLVHTACKKDSIDNNTTEPITLNTEPVTLNKILYQSTGIIWEWKL